MIRKFKGGMSYIADTAKDLVKDEIYNMGDECIVIETGEHYVYNSEGKWCLEKNPYPPDNITVYAVPEAEKSTMKATIKSEIEAEAKADILKNQADIKAIQDRSPAKNGAFGLKLSEKDGKSLVEAIDELHVGMYTVYVQKGVKDNPVWADPDSSLRGVIHLTNSHNDSSNQKDYGWVMLMDKLNNVFIRHLYRGEWSDWCRMASMDVVTDLTVRIDKLEREILRLS